MTKIIYKLDKKNSFEYIIIKDHANYAEQGRDIVCAAISAIANGTINFLQLVKVYRQKDTELIELLNELRFGQLSEKSQIILKKIEVEPNYPSDGIQPTQLVATNSEAKKINCLALEKINQPSFFYQAVD
ncbi:6300_t:CDS:2 [Entrophospora sp. SA101]|nr:11272_t:CDS:2 [Entrophospora sp. SA101]CAJ0749135.1 6300_t:CDS:2 [Entrophospora sp. SA101]